MHYLERATRNWRITILGATFFYACAMAMISFQPTVGGEKLCLFAVIACATACVGLYDSLKLRLWSVVFTIATLIAVAWDHHEGIKQYERLVEQAKMVGVP